MTDSRTLGQSVPKEGLFLMDGIEGLRSRTFARAPAQPRLQPSTQNAALYALKQPRPFMPPPVSASVRRRQ